MGDLERGNSVPDPGHAIARGSQYLLQQGQGREFVFDYQDMPAFHGWAV